MPRRPSPAFRSSPRHPDRSAAASPARQVPVAIDVPDEAVGRAGGIAEADRPRSLRVISAAAFAVSCAIQRLSVSFADFGSKPSTRAAAVESRQSARRSTAWSRNCGSSRRAGWTEPDVVTGRNMARQRKAQRVGAILVNDASGSMTLPFDFDILAPQASRTSGGCRHRQTARPA